MYNDNLEPEPDYNVEADEVDMVTMETVVKKSEGSSSQLSEDVLIQPKKLPNPCVESPTRQALHKELLLNYKRYGMLLQLIAKSILLFFLKLQSNLCLRPPVN
jgi:hypothetical protein